MARNHRGNLRRKQKTNRKLDKHDSSFHIRERKIKKELNRFITAYKNMHHPCYVEEYVYMDKLRHNLKRLFDLQGSELWRYDHKHTVKYYRMLDKFKYFYSRWKRWTYYTYLHVRFGVPFHLMARLKYCRRTQHLVIGGVFL